MFTDLEIRVLTCKRDVGMTLNMVNSLRRYTPFKSIPIYFHNDGSLDDECKRILLSIENSYIIDRVIADDAISEFIKNYPNCKRYRFENVRIFNNTKMKLFDFYFISNSKNILCIDTDILFLNEPKTIIELINKSIPFYFPDFKNAYSFSKSSKLNILDTVNVGIFYSPSKDHYDITSIECALNDLFTIGITNGDWIEQSAWSHMFYTDGRYVKLDETKYQIPNPYQPISLDVESLHFVGHPPIRKIYDDFLKREYL